MKKLITSNHKLHIARQLLESISEVANTAYYLFVGDHVQRQDSTIPDIYDKQKDVFVDPYRNMIMGKRVAVNDMALMIENKPYVSGTVYAHYDDDDNNIKLKDYYCVVDEGSYKHVYVCLDNNGNIASTVQPEFVHVAGSNTYNYETSDGYRWKYMYSVSSSIVKKFGTAEYIPVVANNEVKTNAVDGAIDFIKITSSGRGYDNHLSGSFINSDIAYLGQPKVFRITNSVSSSITNFYADSLIYLAEGTGAGQHANISAYTVNSSGRFITVENEFSVIPDSTTQYQITPKIKITSDGSQTINAVARALVNTVASNSIYRVEILNRGAGYDYYTAEVIPPANNIAYISKAAELRTIASPPGGHGFDVAKELDSTRLCVSVRLEGSEANTILVKNEFKQVGILKDPLFSNVQVDFSNSTGTFISTPPEIVYKITPKRFHFGAVSNTSSANISCQNGLFENQLVQGDYVYLVSGEDRQLSIVKNVHSNTTFELETNAYFSSSNVEIYYANVSSYGYVANVNISSIVLANVSGVISTNDTLIGKNSGATLKVDSIKRNDKAKTFNTFIQLYKYVISVEASQFVENEYVYQPSTGAKAYVHSTLNVDGNTEIYTSNQIGQFSVGNTIVGNTSGAIANVVSVYNPEILFGSGDVLYVENTEAFFRSNTQSETFKIIFEF